MKLPRLKLRFNATHSASVFGGDAIAGDIGIKRRGSWVEHFDVKHNPSAELYGPQTRISSIISERSWTWFLLAIAAIISIVIGRAFFLQVYEGTRYRAIAEGNRIRSIPILPKRGLIYDRNGQQIAVNVPLFLLIVRAADLPKNPDERNQILIKTQEMGSRMSLQELEKELAKKPEVVVAELPYEAALTNIPIAQDLPGIEVVLYERRNYLDSEIFSHVIGYLGPVTEDEVDTLSDNYLLNDYVGKIGVERIYETELRGILGSNNVEVDSRGKIEKVTSIKDPIDGLNLYLTIDAEMQKKAYELLRETLSDNEHKRAAFIVTEPATGKVLTLVSFPGYDNQAFYQGIESEAYQALLNDPDKPLFNRSISGQYPPGSTFKTVLATAGLELGLVTPQTSFLSTGGISVSRWFFPDWKAGGHGYTNIYKAIAESVNTYFYILGGGYRDFQGLGSENIRKKAIDYGLLKPSGIDLTGEAAGFFPTPEWKKEVKNEPWYIGDTYNLSIGQGDVLVTPIQMTMLTSAVANGGTLYKPHLLDHFSSSEQELLFRDNNWVAREQVASPEAMAVIKRAMRETVIGPTGSARSLQVVPSTVAGKTGTAQWNSTEDFHGWFIGFAPYENPEIAITILVESSGGGSEVSVPIAKQFLTWYFTDYKQNL